MLVERVQGQKNERAKRMWQLVEDDLESIAIGAGILGTGGGGNPYIGRLRARQAIREHGPVNVLSPEELTSEDRIICVGGIGAPTVGIEKLRDYQSYTALRAIEEYTGERATAIISKASGESVSNSETGRSGDSSILYSGTSRSWRSCSDI